MYLSKNQSDQIIDVAYSYLGKPFDFEKFNCVHFVREVYFKVGINLPLLVRKYLPPADFHLSSVEFALMPVGHTVFFKRKESKLDRSWTHVGIIVGPDKLIHCTRNLGDGVVVTEKSQLMEVYSLSPKNTFQSYNFFTPV